MVRGLMLCFAATVVMVTALYNTVGQVSGKSREGDDSLTGNGFWGIQPDDFSNFSLTQSPAVQDDLGLSDDQRDRLRRLYRSMTPGFARRIAGNPSAKELELEAALDNEYAAAQQEFT